MDDKITITVNGKSKKLVMSYGLLDELSAIVGSPEMATQAAFQPEMRKAVLHAILAERDEDGTAAEGRLPEVGRDDVVKLLDWSMRHVLDFFLTLLASVNQMSADMEPKLKSVMPSSTGSEDSASANPSPGLSAAS